MRRATARKLALVEAAPAAFGEMRLADLGARQCRFACTPDAAPSHRFCGRPTTPGPGNRFGSWCAEHLPLIWDGGRGGPRSFPVPIRRKS